MANKESHATPKSVEIELDIGTNLAKSSKVLSLDLSSIRDHKPEDVQKKW